VSVKFNHTIVHVRDRWAAARDVGGVLGLGEPTGYGPFAVLERDNGASPRCTRPVLLGDS
jgi:hypothetical protein